MRRGLKPSAPKPRRRGWRKASASGRRRAISGAALTPGIGLAGLSMCWRGRKPRGILRAGIRVTASQ